MQHLAFLKAILKASVAARDATPYAATPGADGRLRRGGGGGAVGREAAGRLRVVEFEVKVRVVLSVCTPKRRMMGAAVHLHSVLTSVSDRGTRMVSITLRPIYQL